MLSKQSKIFLEHLKKECKKNGVKLTMSNSTSVDANGVKICGYFDPVERELAIAINQPEANWISTAVHESCHMDQWKENTTIWKACQFNNFDASEMLDMWLAKRVELTSKQRRAYIRSTMELELDCEIRTVAKIRKFDLRVDEEEYTKGAIAYIWSYKVVENTRRWWTIVPYKVKEIVSRMPNKFPTNLSTVNKKYLDLIKKYSF